MSEPLDAIADVCLVVEGAYPFVTGGVSSWVHDLIRAQSDRSFHVVALKPDPRPLTRRYDPPVNALSLTEVPLQPANTRRTAALSGEVARTVGSALARLWRDGGLDDFASLMDALREPLRRSTAAEILNSPALYAEIEAMYEASMPASSFLQYFWAWRAVAGGLISILASPIPKARAYHTVSTGYAGLWAARARRETGRPAILTEHGIYTTERRIEILMAEWLTSKVQAGLALTADAQDLRDVWINAFRGYARTCYQAASDIVTLHEGNRAAQIADGAPPERTRVIPNGVDPERFRPRAARGDRPPTVALIGRVVPIKDVKTYLRACALLAPKWPELRALVIGPLDEDPDYAAQCRELAATLGLADRVRFTGRARIEDHLPGVDVVALTSLSEAQPLTILEAGAAEIPAVATDVGACREMIEGRPDEDPRCGPGGIVTALASPGAVADALDALLADPERRRACGANLRRRVLRRYHADVIAAAYRELYGRRVAEPDCPPVPGRPAPLRPARTWPFHARAWPA